MAYNLKDIVYKTFPTKVEVKDADGNITDTYYNFKVISVANDAKGFEKGDYVDVRIEQALIDPILSVVQTAVTNYITTNYNT